MVKTLEEENFELENSIKIQKGKIICGQNTEEENFELENSIKIQKGKICYVFYIPVLFQISMK